MDRVTEMSLAISTASSSFPRKRESMCGRPPGCKDFAARTGLVGCGHVSGLYVRSDRPLAQMGYADRVPNRAVTLERHWIPRAVPILGSTDRHLAAFLASARWVGW